MERNMTNFIKYIILFISISVSTLTFSNDKVQEDSVSKNLQQRLIDSEHIDTSNFYAQKLFKHAQKINNDSVLIRTHQNLGNKYILNDQSDSAIYHYNTALQLAETKNKPSLIIRSHVLIGMYCMKQSTIKNAKRHYKIAINLAHQHKIPRSEALSYVKLGTANWEHGNLKQALKAFISGDSVIEKNNLDELKIYTLTNISNVYGADKQWTLALTKLNEVLDLAQKKNDFYYQAWANNNIGVIYEELKDYKKALSFYLESLELRKIGKITTGLASNYQHIGSVNYQLGNYQEAIKYLNKALTIAKKNKTKLYLIHIYKSLTKVYLKTNELVKADHFLTQATNLAQETDFQSIFIDLTKLRIEYYFQTKAYTLAQKTFIEYDSLRDELTKNEKEESIIQMQTQYETEKKEKENELLKAKNQLSELKLEKEIESKNQIVIGLVFSILLLIIIIILLRNRTIANRINKDINIKLEESNKQLQIINSTKDKFFSIIAHDLRSPLGAILSFSKLIDNESKASKEIELIAEYNNLVNQSAHKLYSLLENLLTWAKSQLGSISYIVVPCDLSDIVLDNIEVLKLKAKEKSIEITTKLDANIQVYADTNMLNTVIRNLLSNAIKFSFPKSTVTISHKIEGNMVSLSVQDQGVGISQAQQDKLFNIESNESTLGTNKETGTGLGLILCKEFVEKNGGSIWIESEEGKGSIFTFTIPLQNS